MNPGTSVIIGQIMGGLFAVVIGSLIASAILRFLLSTFFQIIIPFAEVFKVVICVMFINHLIGFAIEFMMAMFLSPTNAQIAGGIVSTIIGMIISGVAYGLFLKDSSGTPIGLARGFLLCVANFIFLLLVCGGLAAVIFGILAFAGAL